MWLKAQNEMEGLWPHAAMGPVERMVRRQCVCNLKMYAGAGRRRKQGNAGGDDAGRAGDCKVMRAAGMVVS